MNEKDSDKKDLEIKTKSVNKSIREREMRFLNEKAQKREPNYSTTTYEKLIDGKIVYRTKNHKVDFEGRLELYENKIRLGEI